MTRHVASCRRQGAADGAAGGGEEQQQGPHRAAPLPGRRRAARARQLRRPGQATCHCCGSPSAMLCRELKWHQLRMAYMLMHLQLST